MSTGATTFANARTTIRIPTPRRRPPSGSARRHESVIVTLPAATDRPLPADVPHSDGLELVLSVRPVQRHEEAGVPKGTRSVAVFLVNHREPAPDGVRDQAFAFQAALTLKL